MAVTILTSLVTYNKMRNRHRKRESILPTIQRSAKNSKQKQVAMRHHMPTRYTSGRRNENHKIVSPQQITTPKTPPLPNKVIITKLQSFYKSVLKRELYVCSIAAEKKKSSAEEMMPFDTDSFPIIIDTGCSRSITSYINDFVPSTLRLPDKKKIGIQGIAGTRVEVHKIGTIKWVVQDKSGSNRTIILPDSLYVPSIDVRLLSPQHMAQTNKKDNVKCTVVADKMVLSWGKGINVSVPIQPENANIATIWTAPGFKCFRMFASVLSDTYGMDKAATMSTRMDKKKKKVSLEIAPGSDDKGSFIEPPDQNDPSTRMHLVDAVDPIDVDTIDLEPLREGPLQLDIVSMPHEIDEGLEIDITSDSFINTKRPEELKLLWHYKLGHISMDRIDTLAKLGYLPKILSTCAHPICQACIYGKMTRKPWRSKTSTKPSSKVPITAPGQVVSVDQLESTIAGLIGQMKGILTTARYRVATIFVDHYSSLSYVFLQQSTTAKETMLAKEAFELFASSYGVRIKQYQADNGRFAENLWRESVNKHGQLLTFSGVGAHHQNGRAEKRIRDLQDLARTSLIHANSKWPDAVSTHLWGYALKHANECMINTHFKDKEHTPIEMFSNLKQVSNLSHLHPFGCPAYVLGDKQQMGNKAPKWDNRARMAMYIGPSSQHARSVALLLSLTTGLVSAQFHVKFDDSFQTVTGIRNFIVRSSWQTKAGFDKEKQHKRQTLEVPNALPEIPISELLPSQISEENVSENEGANFYEEEKDEQAEIVDDDSDQEDDAPVRASTSTGVATVTRSGRSSKQPSRYDDYHVAYSVDEVAYDAYDTIYALAASTDPDVLYLHQALRAPDRKEFIAAMKKEVDAHVKNNNWKVVNRSSVPKGRKVVPSVWAMRRKRDISSQEVYKWKARINFHGGKQEKGIDYWDTYAPVATWPTIRLIMILAVTNKWMTRQLDFVLAFPQAPVETDLYMEIPPGFKMTPHDYTEQDRIDADRGIILPSDPDERKYVLQLLNNLYGQKQAGRVWNQFLTNGLKKLGFQQSVNDPCVFWRGTVIIVIYTDDTIVTGCDKDAINKAIDDIGSMFEITHKECVEDFLGVKIDRDEQGRNVSMTQPQLIASILKDLKLTETSNTRAIPALSTLILHAYEGSENHDDTWSFRSVIGKLNYLAKCTRPDIEYAVHQCARFSSDPKIEHSKAVKLIGRYLLGTNDKGIIYNPMMKSVECYVDADFAGAWEPSIAEFDSTTARSRTGYVIKYANCPIIWASKLQTEIALSSTESEYIALSQGLREVIPLIRLIVELKGAGFDMADGTPKVHCTVFEDNNGALEMARTPKLRPRTKHLNIKYHHFRQHVEDNVISIHPIDTSDQQADALTKPLAVRLFEKFRMLIMGW